MIPKLNIDFPISRVMKSFVPWIKGINYPSEADNMFFLNHNRTGLRIALSALSLPKGSKIGLSMYNCLTVMNAVRLAGYEIVFIDITEDLLLDINDLKKKKNELSAIIVTHFFGIPSNIEAIKTIIPDIPIIEDCAHAYGSLYNDGSSVGTKGDFAVFSIGLGKFPSIGDGGLLVVNNNHYIKMVKEQVSSIRDFSFLEELILIFKCFIKHLAYRPLIYKFLLPLKRKKQEKGSFDEMYQQKEAFMPKCVHYLYDRELPTINEQIVKRQNFSEMLSNKLSSKVGIYVPNIKNGRSNGFLFPIIVENKTELLQDVFFAKFELTTHFAKSVIWAKAFGYQNDCPKAEKICHNLLAIPTHFIVKE